MTGNIGGNFVGSCTVGITLNAHRSKLLRYLFHLQDMNQTCFLAPLLILLQYFILLQQLSDISNYDITCSVTKI